MPTVQRRQAIPSSCADPLQGDRPLQSRTATCPGTEVTPPASEFAERQAIVSGSQPLICAIVHVILGPVERIRGRGIPQMRRVLNVLADEANRSIGEQE